MVRLIKDGKRAEDDDGASVSEFSEFLKERRINLESQVSLSVEAANALMAKLGVELAPFRAITHEMCPWEEKSAALRLSNKIRKCKRNKRWRKAKRKRIAEMSAKVDWFVPFPSSFPIGMQKILNWFNLLTFFIALVMHRSAKDSKKLIEKLMSGEPGKLPKILLNARY